MDELEATVRAALASIGLGEATKYGDPKYPKVTRGYFLHRDERLERITLMYTVGTVTEGNYGVVHHAVEQEKVAWMRKAITANAPELEVLVEQEEHRRRLIVLRKGMWLFR